MRLKNKKNKWNKIFFSKKCGNYYSISPCKAASCNPRHEYCPGHKKIIKARNKNEMDN